MLLQFYTIFNETSVLMSWPEDIDLLSIALDKIHKFCFCFLFCELKLFHDSSYIQRQTYSGGGHTFSECLFLHHFIPYSKKKIQS